MTPQDSPHPQIPASLWVAELKRRRQVVSDSLVEQGVDRAYLESLSLRAFMGFIAEHVEGSPLDAETWRKTLQAHKQFGI